MDFSVHLHSSISFDSAEYHRLRLSRHRHCFNWTRSRYHRQDQRRVRISVLEGTLSSSNDVSFRFTSSSYLPSLFGDYNLVGIYLFALGVIQLILCRQQVFFLTGLIVLVFFQLVDLSRRLVTYGFIIDSWRKACDSGSSSKLCESSLQIMFIVSLLCVCLSIVLIIWNMFVIKQASDSRANHAAQRQPITVSYSNAGAILTTQ